MDIKATGIGKKFGKTWIFKDLSLSIPSGGRQVITGPNGSGKSTFLQILSGFLIADKGTVEYVTSGETILPEKISSHCSLAAPYLELIEELTLTEHILFHQKFRSIRKGLTTEKLVALSGLSKSQDKPIRVYSSGMKQRVRLLLAICTESSLLLLDEPTSNLDKAAVRWYQDLLQNYGGDRTIIVSSNHQEQDYPGFQDFFDLSL
jgi:ABC-2 type transport system ATP-binding protein